MATTLRFLNKAIGMKHFSFREYENNLEFIIQFSHKDWSIENQCRINQSEHKSIDFFLYQKDEDELKILEKVEILSEILDTHDFTEVSIEKNEDIIQINCS